MYLAACRCACVCVLSPYLYSFRPLLGPSRCPYLLNHSILEARFPVTQATCYPKKVPFVLQSTRVYTFFVLYSCTRKLLLRRTSTGNKSRRDSNKERKVSFARVALIASTTYNCSVVFADSGAKLLQPLLLLLLLLHHSHELPKHAATVHWCSFGAVASRRRMKFLVSPREVEIAD